MRIVFNRGVKTEAAGMQIDPLPEIGDILRRFVRDSRNVVFENQHGGGVMAIRRNLLNVNHGAVGDPANLIQPSAALALDFFGPLRLATKERDAARLSPRRREPECKCEPDPYRWDERRVGCSKNSICRNGPRRKRDGGYEGGGGRTLALERASFVELLTSGFWLLASGFWLLAFGF